MARIKYGVYPNPLPDAEGNTTYQVRHEPDGTMNESAFLSHLKYHGTFNTTTMSAALTVLKDEIIEQLKDNRRFRIDGLGTFQMKVGLKEKTDDEGNPIKTVYTDPRQITANEVEVTGVSFIPDKSFINELKERTSMKNALGRGRVGHSNNYTRQEIINFLNAYLTQYGFITRRTLQSHLGLTQHAAIKWLDTLCNEASPKYVARKEGTTIVYRRNEKEG